jgi:hypothetical protein
MELIRWKVLCQSVMHGTSLGEEAAGSSVPVYYAAVHDLFAESGYLPIH